MTMLISYSPFQFSTIESVLDAARDRHPELGNMLDSIVQTIALTRRESGVNRESIRQQHLKMSLESLTYDFLKGFLDHYAPLQLVYDQRKAKPLRFPRKLMVISENMRRIHSFVLGNQASLEDQTSVVKLSERLVVDRRSALPHPEWSSFHDAVMILAIAKHGWIDHESSCRDMISDDKVRWGVPFSTSSDSPTHAPSGSHGKMTVSVVAERAALMFNRHPELLEGTKGFNKDIVVRTYGLALQTSTEEGTLSPTWVVEEPTGTTEEDNGEPVPLPPRKDMARRAKALVEKLSSITTKKSDTGIGSFGYAVLDQGSPQNVLLAQLLHAAIKTSTSNAQSRAIWRLVVEEARALATSKENTAPGSVDYPLILEHLELAKQSLPRNVTQSKNVLRVILSLQPTNVRGGGSMDALFPVERKAPPLAMRPSSKVLQTRPMSVTTTAAATATQASAPTVAGPTSTWKPFAEDALDNSTIPLNHRVAANGLTMARNQSGIVPLTEIEVIIVSLVASSGLPVMLGSDPKSPILPELYWAHLGKMLYDTAVKHRDNWLVQLGIVRDRTPLAGNSANFNEMHALLVQNEIMTERMQRVVEQAAGYCHDPSNLAQKILILINRIVANMGSKTMASSPKCDGGLGARVLKWFEQNQYAMSSKFKLVEGPTPMAFVAADFIPEVGIEERKTIDIAAYLDVTACRLIAGQMAMTTRLRRLFLEHRESAVTRVWVAVEEIKSGTDSWVTKPTWWNLNDTSAQHDALLLERMHTVGLNDSLSCQLPFGKTDEVGIGAILGLSSNILSLTHDTVLFAIVRQVQSDGSRPPATGQPSHSSDSHGRRRRKAQGEAQGKRLDRPHRISGEEAEGDVVDPIVGSP